MITLSLLHHRHCTRCVSGTAYNTPCPRVVLRVEDAGETTRNPARVDSVYRRAALYHQRCRPRTTEHTAMGAYQRLGERRTPIS